LTSTSCTSTSARADRTDNRSENRGGRAGRARDAACDELPSLRIVRWRVSAQVGERSKEPPATSVAKKATVSRKVTPNHV